MVEACCCHSRTGSQGLDLILVNSFWLGIFYEATAAFAICRCVIYAWNSFKQYAIAQHFLYNGVEIQALFNVLWCMLCTCSHVLWLLAHLNNNLLMYFLSNLIEAYCIKHAENKYGIVWACLIVKTWKKSNMELLFGSWVTPLNVMLLCLYLSGGIWKGKIMVYVHDCCWRIFLEWPTKF